MRITSQANRCTAMTLLWVWTLPLAAQQDSEVAATQYAAMSEEISRYEQELASLEGSYNQSSAELYRSLGDIYARMGQGEEAIQAYREALQALRIAQVWMLWRGFLLMADMFRPSSLLMSAGLL